MLLLSSGRTVIVKNLNSRRYITCYGFRCLGGSVQLGEMRASLQSTLSVHNSIISVYYIIIHNNIPRLSSKEINWIYFSLHSKQNVNISQSIFIPFFHQHSFIFDVLFFYKRYK
jgi:hypothetical protein